MPREPAAGLWTHSMSRVRSCWVLANSSLPTIVKRHSPPRPGCQSRIQPAKAPDNACRQSGCADENTCPFARLRSSMTRLAFTEYDAYTETVRNVSVSMRMCSRQVSKWTLQYLRIQRLYEARRLLRASCQNRTTVTQIAFGLGFWDLGRFAGRYHTLFGEHPSETLRKDVTDRHANTKPPGQRGGVTEGGPPFKVSGVLSL